LFSLAKSAKIVQVCMLLHNFIIDNERDEVQYSAQDFDIEIDSTQQELTRQTGEIPRALVTDNNEPRQRGRPTNDELSLHVRGEDI
jgi:hypothetical protein